MPTKKKDPYADLDAAILEMANDFRASGTLDQTTYDKITLNQLDRSAAAHYAPLTGGEIRALREQAHMSQAVFARYLNLTVSYISQLERGAKRPTGSALAILNVIQRKGIEAIL